MPGMSGLDLQTELQTRCPCIPIIFITALPEDRIRRRAEAARAVSFFSKPVDGRTIVDCFNAALSGIGSRRQRYVLRFWSALKQGEHDNGAHCMSPSIVGCSQRSRHVVEQKHTRPCLISFVSTPR